MRGGLWTALYVVAVAIGFALPSTWRTEIAYMLGFFLVIYMSQKISDAEREIDGLRKRVDQLDDNMRKLASIVCEHL